MSGIAQSTTAAGAVRAGLVKVKVDGVLYRVKGAVDYDLGLPVREPIVGQDGVHGFTEKPGVAYVECSITDGSDYDLKAILNADDATVTVEKNDGKVITFSNCTRTGEAKINSEENEIGSVRWTSLNEGIES